jgi:lysophospholipase L1-like esterase
MSVRNAMLNFMMLSNGLAKLIVSFLTGAGGFTFTRSGTQDFTDFEDETKTVPQDQSAHVGARMVENLTPSDLSAWGDSISGGAVITDNGDGTKTINSPAGGRAFSFFTTGSLGIGDYRITLSVSDVELVTDLNFFGLGSGTGTASFQAVKLLDDSDKRLSATITVTVAGTIQLRMGNGTSNNAEGVVKMAQPVFEEVTGQFNQNPSEFVEAVKFSSLENGNSVDSNGVVTAAAGIVIPQSDEFSRHEDNFLGDSKWSEFTAPTETGATFTISADDRTATVTNPGGGRAFVGKTFSFVSGRTYCLSSRATQLSGGIGIKKNMSALVTAPTGEKDLDFPSNGLLQVIFTATVTEDKLVRFGIGINAAEVTAAVWEIEAPILRDVTGLTNQNAPSDVVDGLQAFLLTNENTVSANVVAEVGALSVGPVRGYDSLVIHGDSFTNDSSELGSNLPTLSGVVFETKGVAGNKLGQIRAIMIADLPRSPINAVLIEGGINDIIVASVDPTAQMMIDQAAMVAHAVGNGLQYQVYTIGPWKGATEATWTAERQGWQDTYNAWVISTYDPRRVTDMFTILEDPGTPDTLLAAFDSGDGLHPNAAGFAAVDAVTDPLLTPEFMQGILLDTSPTEMRRPWLVPVNGVSFQLKATMNFNGSDAKGADHALLSLVFDATNYLEVAVDAVNDQIHFNRSVGGVIGTASTAVAALNYVVGDELNLRGVADKDGLRFWVDAVTAASTTTAAKADFTSPPTEIRINENAAGVTGVSIAAASSSTWNFSQSDAFLASLM